jgi:hypothetical protein
MDDKIYYPEVIQNTSSWEGDIETSNTPTMKSYTGQTRPTPPETVGKANFPISKFSSDVMSRTLNTKTKKILGEYTFGIMGAISIGVYENGVSGDVRITPDGITARNINGTTTFSIDGATGDAVFLGTIVAGAVVSGQVTVTGAFVVNDGTYNVIWLGYLEGGF